MIRVSKIQITTLEWLVRAAREEENYNGHPDKQFSPLAVNFVDAVWMNRKTIKRLI